MLLSIPTFILILIVIFVLFLILVGVIVFFGLGARGVGHSRVAGEDDTLKTEPLTHPKK